MMNIKENYDYKTCLKKAWIIFYLILTPSVLIFAQAPTYFSITTDDGLPSNTVYFIHQDKAGFLWLATEDGICKYNGNEFEYFDHSGLEDNDIIGIYADENERIWFWNISGELAYIEGSEIKKMSFGEPIDLFKIVGFRVDSRGLYWIATFNDGVWRYDPKTQKTKQFLYRGTRITYTIEEDDSGNILLDYYLKIDTTDNVTALGQNNFVIRKTHTDRIIAHSWADSHVAELVKDSLHTLVSKGFPLIKEKFINAFEDQAGTIWLTTTEQLFGIRKDGRWVNNGQPFFSDLAINHFLQDREGNYWLAIEKKGLRMYPSFDILTYTPYNSNLHGESVYSLSANKNKTLLIGQDKGTVSILKGDKFYYKQLDTEEEIYSTLALKNNDFMVGAVPPTVLTEDLAVVSSFARLDKPKAFFEDTVNLNRFIGSYWGVYIDSFRMAKNRFGTYSNVNRLSIDRTYAINKDYKKDRIWFGKVNGLQYLENENVVDYTIEGLQKQPWVSDIIMGKDGNMWIGTFENGVLWLKYDKLIRQYDKASGLTDNHCNAIILDKDVLWVGTNKGLNKIDLKNDNIDVINRLDGLPNNEITALYKSEGILYVGSPSGLTVFDEKVIKKNKKQPHVLITGVKVFGQDSLVRRTYDLAYNQNNIEISFAGLNFRSQRKNQFKYRMLGVDTAWTFTNSNAVSLLALAPNFYTFQVVAINEDGVESAAAAEIKVLINLPFWRTFWFNAALILGLSGFMFGVFYLWFQQYRQKVRLKDELDQKVTTLTMRALQSQMNPHFVFNALNGIQRFIISGERKEAMAYLSKFARLIRLIFEYSKRTKITLVSELEFLELYLELEKFRFKDKVKVDLKSNTLKDAESIFIPPLLVQPIVENAFKHGLLHKKTGGILNITFLQIEEHLLQCIIEDNGVGRVASAELAGWKPKEYRSSGLQTTRDRLQLLNQNMASSNPVLFKIIDLKDENEKPLGTRVELLIPLETLSELTA